jgi:hypothetical protein
MVTGVQHGKADEPAEQRAEWLNRLSDLVKSVKDWAEALDWSTRRITKKMKDSRLGPYEAPALIMQKETVRVLLDPIARFVPGGGGVVDLYLMPAYDDIASLLYVDGVWRLRYAFSAAAVRDSDEFIPLTREAFAKVLDVMAAHAPESL